jgi:ubiquinone/menaquinone biosynthesis C-methylase UbiE
LLTFAAADGVLNLDMARIVARGSGHVHGIDSSPAMIAAAQAAVESAGLADKCTFEGKIPPPSSLSIDNLPLTHLPF